MFVSDLMVRNVCSCHPENNLAELAEIMWKQRCGAVPIVDGSGKVTGMITDRDICIALGTRNLRASDVLAREVSPSRCCTCSPESDLRDAVKTMGACEVGRLPVVDKDGKLVGILSVDDIFRAATGTSSLSDREIISAIAAIREERMHQPDMDTQDRIGLLSDVRMPLNYGTEDEPGV
jgi:CBS domain-containing protein